MDFRARGARSSLDYQNILEKHPVILRILESKITFHHSNLQSFILVSVFFGRIRYGVLPSNRRTNVFLLSYLNF